MVFMPVFADVQSFKQNGYISVSSSKSREVDPNIAELSFAVETQAKTVDIAVNSNKNAANKVISSLKPLLDTKNGDTIKTSSFSVRPNYFYPKDKARVLDGYTVVNSVLVKTKKTSSVGSLIDVAVKNGANRLDSLVFSLSDEDSIGNDLYPIAVKDAYSQATVIAKSLNMSILGVKSISANINSQNRPWATAMYAKALDRTEEVSTPIETGKIKVTVTINAEFEVK